MVSSYHGGAGCPHVRELEQPVAERLAVDARAAAAAATAIERVWSCAAAAVGVLRGARRGGLLRRASRGLAIACDNVVRVARVPVGLVDECLVSEQGAAVDRYVSRSRDSILMRHGTFVSLSLCMPCKA